MAAGGTGYFRRDVVRRHIEAGRLQLVKATPEFLFPAYAVYSEHADSQVVGGALEGLRQVAALHVAQAPALKRSAGLSASYPRTRSSSQRP